MSCFQSGCFSLSIRFCTLKFSGSCSVALVRTFLRLVGLAIATTIQSKFRCGAKIVFAMDVKHVAFFGGCCWEYILLESRRAATCSSIGVILCSMCPLSLKRSRNLVSRFWKSTGLF